MATKRCNKDQRRAFLRITGTEPALGTVRERLDIIVMRHGGKVRPMLESEKKKANGKP